MVDGQDVGLVLLPRPAEGHGAGGLGQLAHVMGQEVELLG